MSFFSSLGNLGNVLAGLDPEKLKSLLAGLPGSNPATSPGSIATMPEQGGNPDQEPLRVNGGGSMLSGIFGEAGSEKRGDLGRALFAASANLAANSGPSLEPQSLLSNIGKASGAGMEAYIGAQDDRAKRAFITGQTQSMADARDPNMMAQRALAGQGLVPGQDGTYDYVPGYEERLAQNRHQKMADALTLQNAGTDRQIAAEERQFGRQMDLIDHRADVAAQSRPALTPADKKFVRETQTSISAIDQTLAQLARAEELNGRYETDEKGNRAFKAGNVLSGAGVDARQWMGRNLPSVFGGVAVSKEQQLATSEYSNIVGGQALADIKSYLTGPTSDRDVETVGRLAASTALSPEERAQLLSNSRERLIRQRDMQLGQLGDLGVEMPGQRAQPSQNVDLSGLSVEEARKRMVGLPSGTTVRLPDGRTVRTR